MKKLSTVATLLFALSLLTAATVFNVQDEWQSLFDGKSLHNWKVGDNAQTFTVENGMIVANGPVAHLFYNGDVNGHVFKNFEFKAEVMTIPRFKFRHLYSHGIPGGWLARERI